MLEIQIQDLVLEYSLWLLSFADATQAAAPSEQR